MIDSSVLYSANNMTDKKQLRKHFTEIRKAEKSRDKDIRIAERLLSHERVMSADTILIYASFGSEIDTWELADKLLQAEKKIAFPRCGKDGAMTFHLVESIEKLRSGSTGKYGIYEPDSSLPEPVITDRTICIVPGLAFTGKGERLGYGGGYYDRFLSQHTEIFTVAAAYEAMITDSLPVQEHDVKIKNIVTEERMVLCNE